jgi:hypothetical protein
MSPPFWFALEQTEGARPMSDAPRPPLGPAGGRESTARTSGEPNGPRPPVLEVVDAPAHAIENRLTPEQSSNVVESAVPPHTTGPDVAVHGFHGGVEHSQEMRSARRHDERSGDGAASPSAESARARSGATRPDVAETDGRTR